MGTTIRREPVTTSIPAAPDYRFLNITNFGGIEKSSNPFVVESNTASDCLNVYVDEDNALSTRPRLQYQTSFIQDIINKFPALNLTGAFDSIGVYDLHEGFLVHGVEDNLYYMFKYQNKDSIWQITGENIPTEKCKIFEQNDIIYVLDGEGYKNIKENIISDVEGYIPLVTVGKNKRTETIASDGSKTISYDYGGSPLESLNLLSDKIKESYFWDGTWNIQDLSEKYELSSGFEKTIVYDKGLLDSSSVRNDIFKLIPNYSSDEFDTNKYILLRHKGEQDDRYKIKIGVLNAETESLTQFIPITEASVLPEVKSGVSADCNSDGSIIAVRYETYGEDLGDVRHGGVYLYNAESKKWYDLDSGDNTIFFKNSETGHKSIAVSEDGGVVVALGSTSQISYDAVLVYKYDSNADSYSRYVVTFDPDAYAQLGYNPYLLGVDVSEDGSSVFGILTGMTPLEDEGGDNGLRYSTHLYYAKTQNITKNTVVNLNTGEKEGQYSLAISATIKESDGLLHEYGAYDIAISNNGESIYITYNNRATPKFYSNIYAWVIVDDTTYKSPPHVELPVREKSISNYTTNSVTSPFFTDNKLFVVYDENINTKTGYFVLDGTYRFVPTLIRTPKFTKGETRQYATNDSYFFVAIESGFNEYPVFVHTQLDFNSIEPNVTITRKIEDTQLDVSEYDSLKSIITKINMFARFDNNTWFASSKNNYTFHTLYNDPTYIPLSSYNDLGESFEPITGLSIVNDNVLSAYKRNRIYIITPITVGNERTYTYTETKNIIGNDVIDAPTLTILTEMPIIVSYDGVYALNQLENVQSSDRITTLISEAINPKWLKESKSDVDACLTLNRLYWTYFILPHKKEFNGFTKDTNHTKIYLLDNRTGSWFYWELPIYVISAMIKNNKTHFITEDGELFTLETTDIINKFNKDLTEYYDNLKKPILIPWHWTSQILSLNTINYAKRLVDTTFILTDTDMSDEYALNYKFKAFRKNKNAETTELTLTNDIEYVESITKRTMIPRFNFLQFTLSNTEDDQQLNNNKLRLVGLGLKYVLLGGLY